MDDVDLLAAWRDGDARAGRTLIERHFDALYRFFCSKLGPGADVDDLIQESCLAIVEQRDRFREEASFRTYLFAVARNRLFLYFRSRNPAGLDVDFTTRSIAQLATSPSGAAARRSRDALMLHALRELPVDTQIALELHYWEGMPAPHIASVIEIPEGTVRSRLRRGRAQLRRALARVAGRAPDRELDADLEQWAAPSLRSPSP